MAMTHREALEVLADHRGERVVVTTHGSIDLWVSLSDTPLDFSYAPASMGQGPSLALGLALAQDRRGVVVVSGDGSLLMNLGCLVTLAGQPANLFLIVIDNGAYEVTGGQAIPMAGRIDFAELARSAGLRRVYSFRTAREWRDGAGEALSGSGPAVIWLKVEARPGQLAPSAMRRMDEQVSRLRRALAKEPGAVPAPHETSVSASFFLTTKRIGFRCWAEGDLPLALGLWGDPEVMRFLDARGPLTEEQVRLRLAREAATQQEHGVQYWPIFLLAGGDHLGCSGLRPSKPDEGVYEIGFHLRPAYWGQGYAGEAARAVLEHAFSRLRARAVFAGHDPANDGSRRLLARLGFRYTHDEFYPPTASHHPSYLLGAEEFHRPA
jgi:RimJ/RimL family protein N-acetyltransferase